MSFFVRPDVIKSEYKTPTMLATSGGMSPDIGGLNCMEPNTAFRIPITGHIDGKYKQLIGYALVDEQDYAHLSQFSWRNRNGYVVRTTYRDGRSVNVLMHREIMGLLDRPEIEVDHRNRCRTDNRRLNLRTCTKAQNSANKASRTAAGYKGVYRAKSKHGFTAQLKVDGATKYLGTFETPEQAARVYDVAAYELHGEFAFLNFPREENL